jgi:hypothetical protein
VVVLRKSERILGDLAFWRTAAGRGCLRELTLQRVKIVLTQPAFLRAALFPSALKYSLEPILLQVLFVIAYDLQWRAALRRDIQNPDRLSLDLLALAGRQLVALTGRALFDRTQQHLHVIELAEVVADNDRPFVAFDPRRIFAALDVRELREDVCRASSRAQDEGAQESRE